MQNISGWTVEPPIFYSDITIDRACLGMAQANMSLCKQNTLCWTNIAMENHNV